jgi:hypothetical protein
MGASESHRLHRSTYVISHVQVDDEAEWTAGEDFMGRERVLERGFSVVFDFLADGDRRELE